MDLKNTLDQFTKIIRALQYKEHSRDELVTYLQDLVILVGQVLVQRDSATEKLKEYDNQLWISHITGQVDCPECNCAFPIDFFVGSKGIGGKTLHAGTVDQLIELLEFPPITKDDLKTTPIPDYLPDGL